MEKVTKYKSDLTGQELTFTVSEKMEKLKGKVWAPKKLAEVNEILREAKKKGQLPE